MLKKILFPLFLLVSLSLSAQIEDKIIETVSETSVQVQEIFIDGNREKLLGNWDKAAAKFREVLEKDSKNDAAAYELARVYE